MASLSRAINKSLFDTILPSFGNPRVQIPVWDNSQKLFICNEYESANGNRYYRGIRFSDRLVIVEYVGIYHTWTYIDGIELYAFNGKQIELIQKREYDKVFRSESFVRAESEAMVRDYLAGMLKIQKASISDEELAQEAKSLVDNCYISYLDENYNNRFIQILPTLKLQ